MKYWYLFFHSTRGANGPTRSNQNFVELLLHRDQFEDGWSVCALSLEVRKWNSISISSCSDLPWWGTPASLHGSVSAAWDPGGWPPDTQTCSYVSNFALQTHFELNARHTPPSPGSNPMTSRNHFGDSSHPNCLWLNFAIYPSQVRGFSCGGSNSQVDLEITRNEFWAFSENVEQPNTHTHTHTNTHTPLFFIQTVVSTINMQWDKLDDWTLHFYENSGWV